MKKLVLGAAIAMSSLTFAQQFGVKGGMNVSSISKDGGLSDTSSKIGFNAGVFMNAPLAENFSIQPEVLYNDLGSKVTYGSNDQNSYSTNLGYIAVPVMFQYNATPEFYLEAGPQVSFLVNANSKLKDGNNSTITDWTKTAKDNLNTVDFGVGIGAGYYFTPQLALTARYVAGVTKIGNDDNIIGKAYSDSKNNNFQVGLAYKFSK
ncbi:MULTISPECIES: porin family protein [unclassified Kaistella]|uniref:porin family protein n=1 Tax=unclassified Kaistella TaxID=2762626 RepID=UPI0027324E3D|nr:MULTISPECIES: porin family protein [unclassified Kaistella]MDP2454831.1 porin family protein [Kaistella sp. SH11-4b]MDP2457568.1 porin family protein [Kaistella sp. SH40-3]MDP2460328.1 porin family protein [Kaistella sp. SH19-2b]